SGPNASNEGAYVGIKVQDKDPNSGTEENTPVWRHESSNGYYWSGGAVVDDVIVFAGDDGQLISADLRTGQEVDSLALGGQIRNCVVYDPTSEKVIVSAENSKVHAVALNKDGTFNDTTYMTANLPAASTSPAIVYNGRIYIGSGKTDQGHITVFKLDDLSEIYSATVGSGGIQGGLLATTAYGTDANKQINIYFTRNNNPGGLYMIKDFEGNTTAPEVTDIYIPIDKNYCLSSPIADEDGNIYYSNDSGYLFALTYAPVVESDYDSDKTLQENTEFVYPSGETITFDDITTKEDATFKVQKIDKAIIPQTATVKQSGSVLKVDIGDATLAAPAKLKLPITDMALAEYSSIYYYNETTKAWEYVESTREGKALIASINHFSTYGVLADTTGPKNLFINAMNISENSVTLNFKAYDESPITAYHVYRNDFDNVYKTVTDAALTDTGLVTGTEYNYKIIAEDCFGNKSTLSAVATIVPNKNTSGDGKDEKPSGVPVYMRVVGYDGDIISRKLMYVQNYNLTPYLSEGTGSSTKPSTGWDIDKFPNGASHAHAIESALRQKNISYQFEDYGTGLYLSMINGEKEFDLLGTSGWMYNVNGSLPNVGSEGLSLNDYDDITWYFSAYGYDALFPSIKLSASKIQKEDSLEITLKDIYKKKAISNAVILINGEESPYRTNSEGKATLFFDEDGDYSISAYHKLNGLYDMVHPVPVSLTVGNPKSSGGSGGSSYNGTKETKTPIATQYTEAYAVLRKESTTESEAISSLDNVRDKVYGAMLRANTKEDAIQLSSNAQDAAELIRWSLDKIETPEAAKSTLSYTNDLMSSVAKSTKILAQSDVDQEERSMATASALKAIKANTDNALNTIQLILDKGNGSENMDALVDEFASNVIAVKKNITSAEQEQLDAMMTASAQAFLNAQTEITAETRDDGFVAIFNGISLVDIEALNKQSTELTKKLLEKTGTTPIKTVVPKVVLKVDTDQENQVTAYIDKVSLNNSGLSKASPVIVTTPIGSVELPSEVINASTGNQIKVSLIRVNREDQSPTLKAFIKNDSQVIDVQLSLNRLEKRTFDQPIEVSIPYNAGTDTAHKLVVYHENEDGTFEKFAGVYNEETKMVTFKTPHLSQFFVKPESKNFDDVTTDLWAKKSIERLSALDVINGKDAYNFMPEEKVTRAEFATMLNRLMAAVSDCTESDLTKVTFDDVQNDTWYAENVKSVVAKGWMNGKSSTIFDPNGYITQQEITCVMANILKEQHYLVKIDTQEDSTVANWAQPSVCLVKQLGIMDSLTVRGFLPTEKAQRDEVAVLLDELSKVLIQE
ncbi:MAG: S-layer homology domain-containing protein, partial [Clostridia bacterium]|nr:S-layer homology domain-containing protein [Clostridia bacterium]